MFLALQAAVTGVVGVVLISSGAGPPGLVAAMGLGYAAATVAAFVLVRTRLKIPIVLSGTARKVPSFLRTALPIAATGGIAIVYERIDLLLVSKLDSTSAAAIYGVVLTALAISAILPSIIVPAFFPLLAAGLKEAREQARESFFLLWRLFLLLSVPIALFLLFGSDDLVTAVLGDRYEDAGTPLAIFGGCIVLGFLNYLLWYALLAAYRERRRLLILAISLAVNVGLNFLLIPPYGPTGAAVALAGVGPPVRCLAGGHGAQKRVRRAVPPALPQAGGRGAGGAGGGDSAVGRLRPGRRGRCTVHIRRPCCCSGAT